MPLAESGLFITKKRYAALVYDFEKDGDRLDDTDGKPEQIKSHGSWILRRSDTPKVCHARIPKRTIAYGFD